MNNKTLPKLNKEDSCYVAVERYMESEITAQELWLAGYDHAAAELREEVTRLRNGLIEATNRDCKNRYSVACPSTPMPREEWCGRCIAVVTLDTEPADNIEAELEKGNG